MDEHGKLPPVDLGPDRLEKRIGERMLGDVAQRDDAGRSAVARSRKLVERAKGLLMSKRGMSEDDAYHALRRMSMERKLRMSEVAERVIAMADLLG